MGSFSECVSVLCASFLWFSWISLFTNLTKYSLSIQMCSILKIASSHCAFKILNCFTKIWFTPNFSGVLFLYKAKPHCADVSHQIPKTIDNMEVEGLGYNNWNICDSPETCFPFGMGDFWEETDSFICSTNICVAEWLLRAKYSDK